MTRKSLHFDTPKSIVPTPDPTFSPTVAFQQPTITVLVGANVQNIVFWTSQEPGAYTSLTATVPTLTPVSSSGSASGTATWDKSNVQLSDNGFIQVDIVDPGGSDSDSFQLIVQAVPTISFDTASITIEEGQTAVNEITWGDADAGVGAIVQSVALLSGSGVVDNVSDRRLTTGTARWTLTDALASDPAPVVIITDADGNTAQATFTLTVNAASSGVPIVSTNPSAQIEVPIGPSQLTFTVQDNETTPAKPFAAFRVFDGGGSDISGSGVFSPLPAAVTTSNQTTITWSTSTAFTLIEDGRTWTIEAEDDDGNKGQAVTEIVLAHVDPLKELVDHPVQLASAWSLSIPGEATISSDPLRTLTGHPSPATGDWTVTNGTWSNDGDNGGTTWVSTTVTGYTGGVMLDVQANLTSFRHVVGILEGGAYRARCRIHLKDFNQAVRLRWWNDTTLMSDYSAVGQHILGDFADATELNVISEEMSGSPGDTLTLELWTEVYDDVAKELKSTLTDSEKAFLVQMEMFYDPVSATDPASTELFMWEAGVTPPTKSVYDAAYNALPVDGTTGRPQPTSNTNGPSVGGTGRFQFPINFEIPTMNSDRSLSVFREIPNHDGHNMLRARMINNAQYVESSGYTKPDELFEIELKVDLKGRVDAIGETRFMAWGIIWQGHAGTYPGGWAGNPQLALQIDDAQPERVWRVWVRGLTNPNPASVSDYSHKNSYDLGTVWSGPHHFRIQYRASYTGVNTLFKLWHNDKLEVDVTNIPIGLNFSALGGQGNQSFQHTFGAYGWGITGSQDPSDLTNGRPLMDYKLFSMKGL